MNKRSNLGRRATRTVAISFSISLALLAFDIDLSAAPLRNVPVNLVQPDGKEIHLFVSGDEHFNWLHDKDDHIVIQDPDTGYYSYAGESGGRMRSTTYVVGIDDPDKAGIVRWSIPPGAEQKRWSTIGPRAATAKAGPKSSSTTGTINSLVIFVRFGNEGEFGKKISGYDSILNSTAGGADSVVNFFHEASYDTLTMSTTFYPPPSNGYVVSYQDGYTRNYYRPYSSRNPDGYQNDDDRAYREQTLIKDAIESIASDVPQDLDIDHDNDGYVDSVVLVVSGQPDGWTDLLWPHAWTLFGYDVRINGKSVAYYSFQLQTVTNTGVLAHELSHVLGLPDLYHYYSGGSPIGPWDVMAANNDPPQHMSTYMKYRYLGWIGSIPEINQYDQYSLNPITSPSDNTFKIKSPASDNEYFVVEYRQKRGTFESSVPGTGLIVYRVNTDLDGQGNSNGPPDEIYVFRRGGGPDSNGNVEDAYLTSDVGRDHISDITNPHLFFTDGTLAGISIYDIGEAGDTITFRYKACGCGDKQCGDDGCGVNCGGCPEGQICNKVNQCVVCTPDCNGKQCGDDGCLGSCGVCNSGCKTACNNFACGPKHHAGLGCGSDGVYWIDSCGGQEEINTKCGDGQECMSGVGTNECCTVESDETFCKRRGKLCGDYTATDNCKVQKTVNCGPCGENQICGEDNICTADPNPPSKGCSCNAVGME